jgi:HlyD family secretion protein
MGLDTASETQPGMASFAPLRPREGAPLRGAGDAKRRRARENRRRVARAFRRGLLGLFVLGAAAATLVALRPRPVPADVATAGHGPLVVTIEESGMTRVVDRYLVSAPLTGSMARVPFEPGDSVREGDVLVRVVPAPSPLLDERTRAGAEAQLGSALSALAQARTLADRADVAQQQADRDLARTQLLSASGAVAPQALEQADFDARMRAQEASSARFAGKVAAEQVRVARAALGTDGSRAASARYVDVVAPVSGRILRVHQKSAGIVQAGTLLVEMGDPEALEVVVDLLTTDAVRIGPGTPVELEGWGGDGVLPGRVRRIEPSAFTRPSALGVDEQRVNVIVAFTAPRERWAALADGYRVEARLVLWRGDDVTKVPQGAVFRHGDGWGLFTVQDGVARLVPVVVGHRGETEAEIVSGLAPGTVVIVHPGDRVKDGVRIEAR